MPDPKTLSQRVFEGLSTAMQTISHPSFYEHTLREIGVDLGREVLSNVRQSYLTAPVFHQDDYLRCLEWLKTHWGWNHDVEVATKGLLNISGSSRVTVGLFLRSALTEAGTPRRF
jgi:hypothetical protein